MLQINAQHKKTIVLRLKLICSSPYSYTYCNSNSKHVFNVELVATVTAAAPIVVILLLEVLLLPAPPPWPQVLL